MNLKKTGKVNRRLVIDCNVVISAGLTTATNGICRQVIIEVLKNHDIIVTNAILDEYKAIAAREKFSEVEQILVNIISILELTAIIIKDRVVEDIILPDSKDLIYIWAGVNSRSKYLITGNIKDFPDRCYKDVEILLPKEFLLKSRAKITVL